MISQILQAMQDARRTLTGFLLNIKNDSALCVKNLVNLWTRICSISSACFIRMLTRTLLTLGSMKTFSFSFLATVNGFRSNSGELAASISGTLCLSAVWDAKFESESAAVSEDLTHWRYGLRDCDYKSSVAIELGGVGSLTMMGRVPRSLRAGRWSMRSRPSFGLHPERIGNEVPRISIGSLTPESRCSVPVEMQVDDHLSLSWEIYRLNVGLAQ